MPDQTPVTDDDRRTAIEVSKGITRGDYPMVDAWQVIARVVLSDVPAPPATLADEIMDLGRALDQYGHFDTLGIDVAALADRVEAVEKERNEYRFEVKRLDDELDEARALLATRVDASRLDEARAEVEEWQSKAGQANLDLAKAQREHRAEVERLKSEVNAFIDAHVVNAAKATALPDPADVPEGEVWLVEADGRNAVGVRDGVFPTPPWSVIDTDYGGGSRLGDSFITLLARLVPDVRRVIDRPEDLDKLAEGSIVLDEDGDPWKKIIAGDWAYGHDTIISAGRLLHYSPTVTVIHEPEVTA